MEEFFEEEAGQPGGVVADDAVLFEEVVKNDAVAKLLERGEVHGHGLSAIGTIAAAAFGAILYTVVTGDSIVSALTNIIGRALNTKV